MTTLAATATVSVACGDDGVAPPDVILDDLIRTFTASTFTITNDGVVSDQLGLGASVNITLHPDWTTTGALFIPGAGSGGGDVHADLAGTFAFDEAGERVTFDHAADTFIRDMTFQVTRVDEVVQLEGQESFGGTVVRLVLR